MLAIAGGIFIVVAVVLLVWRRFEEGKLSAVTGTETTTVQELADLVQSASKGFRDTDGAGQAGLQKYAEVKGTVRSEKPLIAEVSEQECVYYKFEVTREYEEQEWDSQEKRNLTKRRTETVSSGEHRAPFWVEDATGKVLVDPAGAIVDAVKVVERFERDTGSGGGISVGEFSINFGSEPNTIGYHYWETILPVDRPVYVLGEANTSSGELRIQRPVGGRKFIISHKSEEELVKATQNRIRLATAGMIACGLVGVALVIGGLIQAV